MNLTLLPSNLREKEIFKITGAQRRVRQYQKFLTCLLLELLKKKKVKMDRENTLRNNT
jgi:hypothetical protein